MPAQATLGSTDDGPPTSVQPPDTSDLARGNVKTLSRFLVVVLACAGLTAGVSTTAWAAPPPNDEWPSATRVNLPFSVVERTRAATIDSTPAPATFCDTTGRHSVWFRIRLGQDHPHMVITTAGSSYDTFMELYRVDGPNDWTQLACNDDGGGGLTSLVQANLKAHNVYYVRVTALGQGGRLDFAVHHSFAATARLARRARFDPVDGTVIVHGRVTCSEPGRATFDISLRQRVGQFFATGAGHKTKRCGPSERRWTARVIPSQTIAFHRGLARVVFANMLACSGNCVPRHFVRNFVRVR